MKTPISSCLANFPPGELARAGFKATLKLAELWDINQTQVCKLLGTSRSSLNRWKKNVEAGKALDVSPDTLDRLSYIMGIRKSVELLYPKHRHNSYMHAPNRQFGGQSALERMTTGKMEDLIDVWRYLDNGRGGAFG